MALIKCPECGKEVSDSAKNCPNCGYPIAKNIKKNKKPSGKKPSRTIMIIAVCVVVIIAIVSIVLLVTRHTRQEDLIGSVSLGQADDKLTEYIDQYNEDKSDFYAEGVEIYKLSSDPESYLIGIETPFELSDDFNLMFPDISTDGTMYYQVDEGIVIQKIFSAKFLTYDTSDSNYDFDDYYDYASKRHMIVSTSPEKDSRMFFDKLMNKVEDSYGKYSSSETEGQDLYKSYESYTWEKRNYNVRLVYAEMNPNVYNGYCEIWLGYSKKDQEGEELEETEQEETEQIDLSDRRTFSSAEEMMDALQGTYTYSDNDDSDAKSTVTIKDDTAEIAQFSDTGKTIHDNTYDVEKWDYKYGSLTVNGANKFVVLSNGDLEHSNGKIFKKDSNVPSSSE